MLQRGPIFVGNLKPVGVARPLSVVRPSSRLSAWATILISCLSTLTLFAAGAAWLVPHDYWAFPTSTRRADLVMPAEASPPATFPLWVEVPHLTGPLSHSNDPDTFSLVDGPRTFLDPTPAIAVEPLAFLPPRANPRIPLLGQAPLDVARLTREQPPAWNERTEGQDSAVSNPPTVVSTLAPDVPQSTLDQVGSRVTPTSPANSVSTVILAPNPAQMPSPPEAVVRPVLPVTASPPSGRTATLSPDPVPQVLDRATVITPPSPRVAAPILNSGRARHAQSLRRAAIAATGARVPDRDAEQTASIISPLKPARSRVDAGAVTHASLHRPRAVRLLATPTTRAPSSPWTLPPALAPTD